MKIDRVGFKNFKCFKDIDLKLGRLSLLTGANSSGKTSVIYGILGALQSEKFPYYFSPNGNFVEMGDFKEISNNHGVDNTIQINFEINTMIKFAIETTWQRNKINDLPELFQANITTELFKISLRKAKDKFEFWYCAADIDFNFFSEILNDFHFATQTDTDSSRKYKWKNIQDKPLKLIFTFDNLSGLIKQLEKKHLKTAEANLISTEFVISTLLMNFNYISSYRLPPKRTYYEQSYPRHKIGILGDGYTDQIIEWQTRHQPLFNALLSNLKELGLVADIKNNRLPGGRYELLVKPTEKSVYSPLADVGFGISQFLPILVADLQLEDGSTLFISQPEMHLHPSVQAKFADYLVKQIVTSNKSYVVETHSEYIINRIRLAIAKKEANGEEINTYFFRNEGDNVKCFELGLLENGQIKNAPEDFFKTYMMDVMEIALNATE